jgi:hypothetical protein
MKSFSAITPGSETPKFYISAAPYDFVKYKAAVVAAAHHDYRGLIWLGPARRSGGAPAFSMQGYH